MPKLDNLEEAVEAEIGERIRSRRASLGMSQAELADRIGMSFQQVQKYERGANRIASSILVRVANALDCAPGDLLGGKKPKGRGPSTADREIDAVVSRIKMLKSASTRKKILAALASMLADAEAAMKPVKPAAPKKAAAAKGKAPSRKAPAKAPANTRKLAR
jgi:transcriptional regulator with XRE-family HTH domain